MAMSAATAATITAVTAIAGAAMSAYGIIQQQQAASEQAKRESRAQERQGMLSLENARMAAAEKRKQAVQTYASQVVSGAGAGVDVESASLVDLMEETANNFEKDRQQLLRTGRIENAAATYSSSGYKTRPGYWKAGAALVEGIGTGMKYGNEAGWFE